MTTPELEKCFRGSDTSGLTAPNILWPRFASDVAEGKYERISARQCYDYQYSFSYVSNYKGLLLLADNLTVSDGGDASILETGPWYGSGWIDTFPFAKKGPSDELVCLGYLGEGSAVREKFTDCLAVEAEEHCQLLYSPTICVVILLATLAKLIAMFFAARVNRYQSRPLLTTGDAVASFLGRPDNTTEGLCWASSRYFQNGHWKSHPEIREGKELVFLHKELPRRKQWRHASSVMRWLATTILSVLKCCTVFGIRLKSTNYN